MNNSSHLSALDGFRGSLAIWVLLGHLSVAAGITLPVVSNPAVAVDLFMMLSGFLMVHTWGPRLDPANVFGRPTLAFYLSRFFRIAPLFYLLLLLAYLFLPALKEMSDFNSSSIPPPWVTNTQDFHPKANWDFENIEWLFLHSTFLFGVVPGMENSSPLPEWSLSLEMQFYLFFPALLLARRKVTFFAMAVLATALSAASPKLFGLYLEPGALSHFGQPSHLLYRLNAFAAGMALAFILRIGNHSEKKTADKVYLGIASLVCVLPLHKLAILAYVLFAAITLSKVPFFTWFFSTRLMRFLGEISYSVYLLHVLILIPTIYFLIRDTDFLSYSPLLRFFVGGAVVIPLVITGSFILYRLVELPTMKHGRSLSKKLLSGPTFQPGAPENPVPRSS